SMSPVLQREKAPDADPSRELVQLVASVLARGGLVAMPTETVYGIAARADLPAALAALRDLKGRPEDLALTWHIGSRALIDAEHLLAPPARRLADRYWPGPLTLVVPVVPPGLESAAREGWTGIRLPAHRATAGILAQLPFPVVLSSANRHGARPATNADEVLESIGDAGRVELLLDGGAAKLSESSCVLRIGRGRFEILREGLIGLDQLRAASGMRLGFACTGNTCRSPMAEAWARKRIADRLEVAPDRLAHFGFVVESMGVQASHGSPASRLAVAVMKELGVDLTGHRSRAAQSRDLLAFDKIYCMTRGHQEALAFVLPPGKTQHIELLDPQGRDVPDPIGGTRDDYSQALTRIRAAIELRLPEWA
ncbi:MAG: Sua5/YciO/YrdC/YwlC family protein, partial [Planctomycetota bacterium]